MSVRYDPLLTLSVAKEIERRWLGAGVRSLGMDPGRSTASVRFSDGTALAALFDRAAGLIVPQDSDPVGDEGVRVTRFGRMTLAGVDTPADERTIMLRLAEDDGSVAAGIVFELQTNRWNVLCLSPRSGTDDAEVEWRVRYALWTREIGGRRLGPGEPYASPESDRRALESPPERAEWEDWLRSLDSADGLPDLRGPVLTTWAWASALNFEWVFADPETSYDRYRELHELRTRCADGTVDAPSWITDRRWGAQPYPHGLGAGGAAGHPDVLSAMLAVLEGSGGIDAALSPDDGPIPDAAEAELLTKRLESRLDREAKRVRALERQLSGAGPPDAPRELGQILLARKDGVARGATSVVLQAFDGSERQIALDPKLDAIANAERFFEEARRRERALDRLPGEIASARTRLAGFTEALERLRRDGPGEELWRFIGERPPSRRKARRAPKQEERRPYTRLRSSGGLEIRVGRGARDNDALTFRHSAPDDIWLHASQASGAHVVLRWGRKEENPPQRDLVEAAVAAAVHSQARHSGSVAVVWTRRKYVRKARKSPPGTVIPERVHTLMVEPDEDLVRRLREDD